jgi:erythromycin esterase
MNRMRTTALIVLLLANSYLCFSQSTELTTGKTIEKKLLKDQNHQYSVNLKWGGFLSFTAMQKGVDLAVDVYSPTGIKIQTFDSPNGAEGPEEVSFDAKWQGVYKIIIHPLEDSSIADNMRAQYKEKNQGDYAIQDVKIVSYKDRQKMLALDKQRQQQFISWISANAHPLNSVNAGSGFEDLQWLKPVLQTVKYVGLGEATHGTREFFQVKHRMLEFLVKEMGFTIFAIEASYSGCQNINDYVLHGKGDAHTALASQGFWTWDTEEVIDMIEWMRTYNATVPEEKKVQFYGFDIQVNSLGGGIDRLQQYLKKVDRSLADSNVFLFQQLPVVDRKLSGDTAIRAKGKLSELLVNMLMRKPHYVLASSEKEYEQALHWGTVIAQLLDAYLMPSSDNRKKEREWRDYYMAANFYDLVQKNPDAKVVVWAHNGHISRNGDGLVNGGIKPFGSYLKDAYGDKYFPIGFAFSSGSFQAIDMGKGLTEFTVKPAKQKSMDWYLASTKNDKFIIDISQKPLPADVQEVLNKPLQTRGFGAVASQSWVNDAYGSIVLSKEFNAIIFIDHTTRARPTATGKR